MAAQIPLPLTQASERSPNIFVDPSGSPLPVYLDVNPEILSRPRLIRLLRTSGADICHNPSTANILLINPDTESGCKFVHDWSADSHKIVLNYGWIQACIQVGRPLLEVDKWGGFHIPHTSGCMYSEDEGDEDMEDDCNGSRAIPSPPSSKSKASLNSTRPKLPSPIQPALTEPSVKLSTHGLARHSMSSSRQPSNAIPIRSPSSKLVSPTMLSPSSKVATGINTQGTPMSHHKSTLPNFVSPQQASLRQPQPLAKEAHMPPPALPLSHSPRPSMPQNIPIAMGHSVPQQPSTDLTNLLHALNSASLLHQNTATQTLAQVIETVIAVAQGQGIDTSIIQNYLATLPISSSPIQPSPSSVSQSSHLLDLTSQPLEELPGPSVSDSSPEVMRQRSSSMRTPRSLSFEPSSTTKRRRSSPKHSSQVKKVPRQNLSRVVHESPQLARGVFSTKNGQPILVFVQIDTRGRHGIVHLIKKNGGQITADIPRAAFVVLNPRSVSYADLRQEAENSEKIIVRIAFITDSIEQGHLVDPSDYLLEDVGMPRKRGRGRAPSSLHDRRSLEGRHKLLEAQTSDTIADAPSSTLSRRLSPTTEPPVAVQSKKGYKYTSAEMTYAWALIRRMISRDRRTNKLAAVKALHQKMPHHSIASWSSLLTREKETYEKVRVEALCSTPSSSAHPPNIWPHQDAHHSRDGTSDAEMDEAYREAELLEELQVGASLVPAEGESMYDDGHQQSSPEDANKDGNEPDAYMHDFEALVEFLASADADGGDEAEIYERLATKSICITAPSWPDFLEQHATAVAEEVERRYAMQQVSSVN